MRTIWSLIALAAGFANDATAIRMSDGECDGGSTPPPIGPDLSLDQIEDEVGGNALALAPSVPIENDVAGFLCGWEVEGERLCVVAFSTPAGLSGSHLSLELFNETAMADALSPPGTESPTLPAAPDLTLVSGTYQAGRWLNGMRVADVMGDDRADLLVSVVDDSNDFWLYVLPGGCDVANRMMARPIDTAGRSRPGSEPPAFIEDMVEACGGTTFSHPVCELDVNSAWDVVALQSGKSGTLQWHVVLPGVDSSLLDSKTCKGNFNVYPAPFDPIDTPLSLRVDNEQLSFGQVRGLPKPDTGGSGGLLVVSGATSAKDTAIAYGVSEQVLVQGLAQTGMSIDLNDDDSIAKKTLIDQGSADETRVSSNGQHPGVFFFVTASSLALTWGILDLSLSSPLTTSFLPLTDNPTPSLSFTSEDMDGDGWPELWFAPVDRVAPSEQNALVAYPNAVGLLLSTRLIDKNTQKLRTDVTPSPGLRVYESHESAAPLLLSSGWLKRTPGNVPSDVPFELIGFGQEVPSSLYLWTGLDRLFDRDEDGVIGSNVPLLTAQWATSEAVSSVPLPGGDCDDHNSTVAPGNPELCDTDVAEDCLGSGHLGCDKDGDKIGQCLDCDHTARPLPRWDQKRGLIHIAVRSRVSHGWSHRFLCRILYESHRTFGHGLPAWRRSRGSIFGGNR